FTSRAEYRLQLREDNADLRLSGRGFELGCVDQQRHDAVRRKREAIAGEEQRLAGLWAAPANALGRALATQLGVELSRETSLRDLLRRPGIGYQALVAVDGCGPGLTDPAVAEQVEVGIKYAGYLQRQADEIARNRQHDDTAIPPGFDFERVRGLSAEVLAKFKATRPQSIGEARRIAGVTPAAVSLLLVHLRRGHRDVA
ncbi:MAG: tRNA uridine-5-carboxymethylaminomethyl(34) synthesis enzyme MnmG, partial [Dokdonella sp.]|nr:tRNA uridine-5-carboxymethylaminomethyl(34) synthesis enzyme MnmG [Dokdonella sp.]